MCAPTPAPVFRPQDHCEPHCAAPRKFRKHGSHTCRTPYQHSWDIPKNAVPAPDRGSGAAHRAQGPPAPLQQGAWPPQKPGILAVFFFFTHPSDIHGPATVWIPEHTPGPALHEAGTCAHVPTPAPVFRPQDHCEPHRAAPRKSRKHGSRTCRTPYQHSWDIPKNAVPAPDRGSGAPRLPTESKGPRPPYGREPGPPRNPRNFGCFFLFTHLSDMHRPATAWIPGRTPGPTLHAAGTCACPPRPRFSGPRTIIANLLVC